MNGSMETQTSNERKRAAHERERRFDAPGFATCVALVLLPAAALLFGLRGPRGPRGPRTALASAHCSARADAGAVRSLSAEVV
eukprot:4556298-Pleurochrysis_carterae.AAC.3